MAWLEEQKSFHTCGQPVDEAFAKENSFKYRAQVLVCHACAAEQRVYSKFTGQDGADSAGVFTRLTYGPHGPI